MSTRRAGNPTGFWNNVAVAINGASNPVLVPRDIDHFVAYVTVSAATTITVEVAHHGAVSAEGIEPDTDNPPSTWFALTYNVDPIVKTFAAAGSAAIMIPDFEPAWVRLRSSAAVTITAGWEGDSI